MEHKILILFLLSFVLTISGNNGKIIIEKNDWAKYYNDVNLDGTFVLTKLNSDTLYYYNLERANKRYLPASTFKIPNSLIALETEVITDENEIIEWDGKIRFIEQWNKDQNLQSAIKYSCVWFYQELARRVGRDRMQLYVDLINYGNSKLGAQIDTFWLEGDIRISPMEQIDFLTAFINRQLPFKKRNIDIVEKILLIDSTNTFRLYAKTGWTARVGFQVGWYVGFVKKNNEIWIFALNIDINEKKDADNRESITRAILKGEGVID